jgi:uracil-DNA glycosylase family protein
MNAPRPPRLPADPAKALAALRKATDRCRECPIGELATQSVFGEGPVGAPLMVVGEQPGDQADLLGRPFVGPAGNCWIARSPSLGWARKRLYVTNAVKHFKFELRGKRRMHKTPAQREVAACLHWQESEIDQVRPSVLIALGATAARALLGRHVPVMRERGHWHTDAHGRPVLITLHPSALLRGDPAGRESAYDRWRSRTWARAASTLQRNPRSPRHPSKAIQVTHPHEVLAGVRLLDVGVREMLPPHRQLVRAL